MDLTSLRAQINETDKQIEALFEKRMGLCMDVAEYKLQNGIEVFQSGREREIIDRVRSDMPGWLENSGEVLFTTLMDISKLDNTMAQMLMETVNNMLIELYAAMAQAEIEKKEKRRENNEEN